MYYYGSGTLKDGLYFLNLDVKFMESLFNVECDVGSKRNVHDDSSAYLWHQRLGHISIERIKRLMKNEIFPQLDFGDWDICLNCIKGKQTKQISKNSTTRSNELLGLIHTDICGPFDIPSWGGEKYFISPLLMIFHIIVIYIFCTKSLNQWMSKVFIDEVERQIDWKVEVIRSDRGGEFLWKI